MRTGNNFRALRVMLQKRRFDDDVEAPVEHVSDADNLAREELAYHLSAQFRLDVIDELIEEGCTRMQAEGRTRDQARLFGEAARLGCL
jgi:hypothetical protein